MNVRTDGNLHAYVFLLKQVRQKQPTSQPIELQRNGLHNRRTRAYYQHVRMRVVLTFFARLSFLVYFFLPTIWITVGQGPTALVVGAGRGVWTFLLSSILFSPLSPSLWETARYRLKYCLKGPLNPKQPTNQLSWRRSDIID